MPCVNTLFESNRYESRTKKTDIRLQNAFLSILAASTLNTYENVWSSQFVDIGFPNRILLIPGSGERKHPIPEPIPTMDKRVISTRLAELLRLTGDRGGGRAGHRIEMAIKADALELYKAWYMGLEKSVHSKRIDVYAMRLMPLLALNEGDTSIDRETVVRTIAIADWQLAVREQLDPIDAESQIAKMEERIRRALKRGPMSTRDLKRAVNYQRYGLWVFD